VAASTERPSGPVGAVGTARTVARPALSVGDLVAERYRLVREVEVPDTGEAPAALWQATDEVLARIVALRLLPAGGRAGKSAAQPFLDAAGKAGQLSHPGLARVYDAGLTPLPSARSGRPTDVAYVVSEWVEGQALTEVLLADGPLAPHRATALALRAAEAVAALHASGLAHGRLHPGNVLLTTDDRLRLTDAAVASALHRTGPDALTPDAAAQDCCDLGALLYGMLTARWPAASTAQPARGVPTAPRASSAAVVYSPRQIRAGIPRALDALVVRILEPGRAGRQPIDDAPALVQALADVELGPVETPTPPPPPRVARRDRETTRWRRSLPALAAVAFLGIVGLSLYQVGQRVGQLPRRAGAIDELVGPSAGPSVGAGALIDLAKAPVVVRAFDPRDGAEQSSTVPNAFDGDPSTAWTTDGYKSARFGGLKDGVGLLVDLGAPTVVASVKAGLTIDGAGIELRSANAAGKSADDFTLVARLAGAKQVATLSSSTGTPARFWLVWITMLPKGQDGRFREGIAELVFTRGR